ncbi:MAG: aminopeptidase N [Thermodesulfobacteriota bacterium]|jgi:aminopeptidase N|nr:aminopeptidase N [Thermodesulfobacteriota bacterium]
MMKKNKALRLEDYCPAPYLVDSVDLRFELDPAATLVRATLAMRRNPEADPNQDRLILDGNHLDLSSIRLDGRELDADRFQVDETHLAIAGVPETFTLETEVVIHPEENTALEGLYLSGGNFCTQCEPEGFRRITYFPDRPDVMATYRVTLVAQREQFPVLLSNGNLVAHGDLDAGRHFAEWEDPFRKPSYLFALVGGKLSCLADSYTSASGRSITLQVYADARHLGQCAHAMKSLKQAMRWDEQRFGLECDLDQYMVVAADDFNMGAMENKGLNIFNSKYVLAASETATDADFQNITSVIGHEYFHNWTGNRVTCRDWFQLSLKEGLTVFRDQEFSADMTARPIQRISDVRIIRGPQFAEDAGPMAHPVRPRSYVEINNFYTLTVYNKGAEVIRMIHTLLGEKAFRAGMDLYFQRHDGQAVTTEDFVRVMEDASGIDLAQFRLWYEQAGTPEVHVERHYDTERQRYRLTFTQSCPPTPGQSNKEPFHIPVAVGLLDRRGRSMHLQLEGEARAKETRARVLSLTQACQTFEFVDVKQEPVPSLLRGFSAPVKMKCDYTDEELAFLAGHDEDEFNRWDAGQQLAVRILLRLVDDLREGRPLQADNRLTDALRDTLENPRLDRAFKAQCLILPDENYLADQMEVADPSAIHHARQWLREHLAADLRKTLLNTWQDNLEADPQQVDAATVGRRSLKNACLSYLSLLDDEIFIELCANQAQLAHNMTDVLAALGILTHRDCPQREEQMAAFYRKWKSEPLVIDKWLSLQAQSSLPQTPQIVENLLRHEAFNIKNPNRVRALIGAFCQGNPYHFHAQDGRGYAFLADRILEIDSFNPQVAARLTTPLGRWRRYDAGRQQLMKTQLERIAAREDLSRDAGEIVEKSLASLENDS